MPRSVLALSACLGGLLILSVPAAAQAMGEAAVGAAASSGAAAGARGVGKSIGGMFGTLNETLKSPHNTTGKTATPQKKSAAPVAALPAPSYEDAMQIQKGIAYEELVRRFGPPAMQFASENDAQTMSYIGKSGAVQLEVRDGKVISVTTIKSGA